MTKPRRLQICPASSAQCSYWQSWFDGKKLKWEVSGGMLYRLMDRDEWAAYLKYVGPQNTDPEAA